MNKDYFIFVWTDLHVTVFPGPWAHDLHVDNLYRLWGVPATSCQRAPASSRFQRSHRARWIHVALAHAMQRGISIYAISFATMTFQIIYSRISAFIWPSFCWWHYGFQWCRWRGHIIVGCPDCNTGYEWFQTKCFENSHSWQGKHSHQTTSRLQLDTPLFERKVLEHINSWPVCFQQLALGMLVPTLSIICKLPRLLSIKTTGCSWIGMFPLTRQIVEREHADLDYQFGSVKSFWPALAVTLACFVPTRHLWPYDFNFPKCVLKKKGEFPKATKETNYLTSNGAWERAV